jgi:drug/metabolite transporter (DMT)-like permease
VSRRQRRASPADLLVLSAVAVWSVNVIVVKLALRDCPPLLYTAVRFLVGGLLLLGCLLFSSVLAVAYCNLAYYHGLETLGPTRAAVYTYLQPFLGAVAAFLMLGETLCPLQLTGGAVVVAGVLLARSRLMPVGLDPGLPAGELEPELAGGTTR